MASGDGSSDATETDSPDTSDAADTMDVYWDPDAIEPFPDPGPPDPGPPDPWVPEAWDAPFDYMDIPADYVPDAESCGNGTVDPGEECDDANLDDHDECTNRCLLPRCGDGSTWYGMEDCDPPGTVRPCTTSCGSTGGERCEVFCRWTGECVPPLETCGNGVDDDCDGVVDSIVRLTPNVVVSVYSVEEEDPTIAWTGSVFGILWVADPDQPVLSLVDVYGRKAGWDADLALGAWDTLHPLVWSGSLFGVLYVENGSELGCGTARLAPLDAVGFQFAPPADLASYYSDEPGKPGYITPLAKYPDGYGLVVFRTYMDEMTGHRRSFLSLVTLGFDGSSIVDHGPMLEYVLGDEDFRAQRMAWTGSDLGLVWNESYNGIWFAPVAADASFENPPARLMVSGASGYPGGPSLAWTGSSFGVTWMDSDGDYRIYFAHILSCP